MSIRWNIELDTEALQAAVHDAIPFAVVRAAEHLRAVAVELAPIREGHLRNSAGVSMPPEKQIGEIAVAEVKFPGPYARRQHYELDWHHPRGGQALYLEQPVITEGDTCRQIMADTIRDAL